MKVLITGGAGFIGLNLARSLAAQGHRTVLLDNFSRGMRDAELEQFCSSGAHSVHHADLLVPGSLNELGKDFDVVCHLAAILGVERVRKDPLSVLRDNLVMNLAVIEFASSQRKLSRFLFASTSEVYAGSLQNFGLPFPTSEQVPLALPNLAEPRTSYMFSKLYGEALCHQAALPFTIVRPHNIYGPRMGVAHVVPQLMERIWRTPAGAELVVFSPDHQRTFCYVEDAVRLMSAAIEAPAGVGRTFNIGNQEPEVTMFRLAEMIAEIMERKVVITRGPETPGSPIRRQPDISAVKGATGLHPAISLTEGLRRTLDWYRTNHLSSVT